MVSALSGGTHPAVTDWERISVIFLQRQNDKETNINPGFFFTFMPSTGPFTLIKIPKVLCTRSLYPDYRKEVTISLLFPELYCEMSSFGKCQPS